MQFKDVISQQEVQQHLLTMVQQNRLSHALLFLGKEGSGALSMALAFAQYMVCDKIQNRQKSAEAALPLFGLNASGQQQTANNNQQTDSCGECPSCVKAAKLIHPDVHFS
jgi:DNA polymerase-3 subunit delta'